MHRELINLFKNNRGSLKVKMLLSNEKEAGEGKEELWEEKSRTDLVIPEIL